MKKVPRRKQVSLKLKARDMLKFASDIYKAREKLGDQSTVTWGTSPAIHAPYPQNQK